MHPQFWGPHAWIFLHSVTFAYPVNPTEDEKKQYHQFFHKLHYVLPCYQCAQHYKKHLEMYPISKSVLQTRNNLIEWLIIVHNEVNKSLGKPVLTTEEVIQEYNQKIHDTRTKKLDYIPYCILLLLIILGIFIYMRQ